MQRLIVGFVRLTLAAREFSQARQKSACRTLGDEQLAIAENQAGRYFDPFSSGSNSREF